MDRRGVLGVRAPPALSAALELPNAAPEVANGPAASPFLFTRDSGEQLLLYSSLARAQLTPAETKRAARDIIVPALTDTKVMGQDAITTTEGAQLLELLSRADDMGRMQLTVLHGQEADRWRSTAPALPVPCPEALLQGVHIWVAGCIPGAPQMIFDVVEWLFMLAPVEAPPRVHAPPALQLLEGDGLCSLESLPIMRFYREWLVLPFNNRQNPRIYPLLKVKGKGLRQVCAAPILCALQHNWAPMYPGGTHGGLPLLISRLGVMSKGHEYQKVRCN
eukprot:CAMPEP_0170137068 /NCGR_PEP_ID=MMETSP0033_2-20121228/3862_1 /TAXON_ID=195969 /ORGANISM="Dolichomastix tenuilepis, Strain CCMP3274" /LENGTH=276 /DNA_ID=CAMNT_0010372895 /DNA_START=197 /DNA_END=1027 /DNA_ORIENTATION=-